LKFQHEWILAYFRAKVNGYTQPNEKAARLVFVENTLRKDAVLRNQLVGGIIGLFSVDELQFYESESSAITKRIVQMLIQRIQSAF
jgi:hypothetical protein